VATAAEVERSIRALAKKLAEASPDPKAVPERTILCVVPDLEIAYWMQLKNAKLSGIKRVSPTESADARLTAKSDDVVALVEGKLNVAAAFLTGRVRIDAPARDLMMLRRLF
jgi:predicted lipid carrier protein YhbT